VSRRFILVSSPYPTADPAEERRRRIARWSWNWHVAHTPGVVERELESAVPPTVPELLDLGLSGATAADVIVYANLDVGFVEDAFERIEAGIEKGLGVTVCSRRSLPDPEPGVMYHDLSALPRDLGIDAIAVSPAWWHRVGRPLMPPMRVGRGGWDVVFLLIAENWADRKPWTEAIDRNRVLESKAHTDGAIWHSPHMPAWYVAWKAGTSDELQKESTRLAREFVDKVGNPEVFV
jgi:hypothetical protein